MKRWGLLVFANMLAMGGLVAMAEAFDDPPWWFLAAVVSLGSPMVLLLVAPFRPDPPLLALILPVNPFLWAAFVEWMLRRYVDRPKDSDTG